MLFSVTRGGDDFGGARNAILPYLLAISTEKKRFGMPLDLKTLSTLGLDYLLALF